MRRKRSNKHISVSAFAVIGYMSKKDKTFNGYLREYEGVILGNKFYRLDGRIIGLTNNPRIKYIQQSKEAVPSWATDRLIERKEEYERELEEAQHKRYDDLKALNPYKSAYAIATHATLKTTHKGRELTEVIDYGVVLGNRFYNLKGRYTELESKEIKKLTFMPSIPTWATAELKELKRAYDIEVATHGKVKIKKTLKLADFKGFNDDEAPTQ